jgi:hypothetical protein
VVPKLAALAAQTCTARHQPLPQPIEVSKDHLCQAEHGLGPKFAGSEPLTGSQGFCLANTPGCGTIGSLLCIPRQYAGAGMRYGKGNVQIYLARP